MFYRDHPQDIRHRTVQSRKPPPMSTHLIKGDPDSATSPSKYRKEVGTVEGEVNIADIPADFAPYDTTDDQKPFRTLSTTDSEVEAAVQKPAAQPRRKIKKKKKKSEMGSGGTGPDETSALMSFLQTKDKTVSHANIENFIHKSKTKYSVNEVRTAIENARNLMDDKPGEVDHEKVANRWRRIAETAKNSNIMSDHEVGQDHSQGQGQTPKSRAMTTLPPKPSDSVKDSKKRLKLITDARSAQKLATLLPEGYKPDPEDPSDKPDAVSTPAKSSPMRQLKNAKARVDSKHSKPGIPQTQSQESGQKLGLPLQTHKKGKKPPPEPHSIEEFYKDFKIIYVPLPEPIDDLPCEYHYPQTL